MIKRELCPNCNGALTKLPDGKLKCECCLSIFDDTAISDDEKALLIIASKLLREGRFDEADKTYRDLLSTYPNNYEAYYGRALAKHGIVFVSDVRAGIGKKIPTCYVTNVGSFISDPNYIKAINYAPSVIADEYKKQGAQIESIIDEWANKASKEKYDVFISFKASEDDTGEETRDLLEAKQLYSFLTEQNLKVFFSPVSLKMHTSERYEPYIFNAINQASVMIVYGQSAEHLEATWVRNEWSRFIKKIQDGEKAPNSLVICYENMSSRDLPIEFKSIQCLNAGEKTFYIDLLKHIKSVLDSQKPAVEKPQPAVSSVSATSSTSSSRVSSYPSNTSINRSTTSNTVGLKHYSNTSSKPSTSSSYTNTKSYSKPKKRFRLGVFLLLLLFCWPASIVYAVVKSKA